MVETGIVASLAHPGGNVTGLSKMTPELTAKRLDLLKEMVPSASQVAVLWDPGYSTYVADWQGLRATARAEGVVLHPVEAHRPDDLDEAFAVMVRERADAVITFSDVMTFNFPGRVAELAAKSKLPLMAPFREITTAGGLMSCGPHRSVWPHLSEDAARGGQCGLKIGLRTHSKNSAAYSQQVVSAL
jgi:putative tryptophan/tyrosine transport system substrate-binding protein